MEIFKKISFERKGLLEQNIYFYKDKDNCPIWKDKNLKGSSYQ